MVFGPFICLVNGSEYASDNKNGLVWLTCASRSSKWSEYRLRVDRLQLVHFFTDVKLSVVLYEVCLLLWPSH